jgi:hypothetical protein
MRPGADPAQHPTASRWRRSTSTSRGRASRRCRRLHRCGAHVGGWATPRPERFRAGRVDDDVAAVRAAAAGRSSPLELQVLVQAVVVTDDAHGTAEQISKSRLPSLTADEVLSTPYLMVGSAATLVDRLIEQRERWGFSHYTVRQDALGQLEPVIAALAGR